MTARSSHAKGRATFATTVSMSLGRAGHRSFQTRGGMAGTALGGYKVLVDSITGDVTVWHRCGSDMDEASDEARVAEQTEMLTAYLGALNHKYTVEIRTRSLIVRRPVR